MPLPSITQYGFYARASIISRYSRSTTRSVNRARRTDLLTAPLMNTTTLAPVAKFARAAALLLTLGLFTIGSIPAAGLVFHGVWHWIAHLAAYALLAVAYGLGWPQRPAMHIALVVAAIGAIHELTEIVTHHHAFEARDVIVNAIGALIGVAIQRAMQRAVSR